MKSTRRRLRTVVIATAAVLLAAPVAGASAQGLSPGLPLPSLGTWMGGTLPSAGGIGVGGNQIGSAGCVGTNRPSVGGNNGSTSAQTCGALLAFTGPQIGQISSVMGPTIIGSPYTQVNVSAGSITAAIP